MKNSTAILVPCYKRPEYTKLCIEGLEKAQNYDNTTFHLWDDGSDDGTEAILNNANLPKKVFINKENKGLRHVLISFIENSGDVEFLSVVGNDCIMPKDWLTKILGTFEKTDLDIVSPNVVPSNAAYQWGVDDVKGLGYRPARTVGGLWTMRKSLTEDIYFEQINCRGIVGAFQVLRQIIVVKKPKVGWITEVEVDDIGHWSGVHPKHIKSPEHKEYSVEIGRRVAW